MILKKKKTHTHTMVIEITVYRVNINDFNPRNQIFLAHRQHISRIRFCGWL